MGNCVFCNFEDKKVIVYEDGICFAVISRNPINKYHVILIPKEHYENFTDLPNRTAAHIFIVAKKISKAVRQACKPTAMHHLSDDDIEKTGYNLVSHYKLHIIPRFENDGIVIEWRRQDLDLRARSKIAEEIKKFL